jgi:hypothetical protein
MITIIYKELSYDYNKFNDYVADVNYIRDKYSNEDKIYINLKLKSI